MNDTLDLYILLLFTAYAGFVFGLFIVSWTQDFVNFVRKISRRIQSRKSDQ